VDLFLKGNISVTRMVDAPGQLPELEISANNLHSLTETPITVSSSPTRAQLSAPK
jgi:hypothetical protein